MKNKFEIRTLGEVCEVIAGQSPPSSTYNYDGRGLPFFQGKADFETLFPTTRVWCDEPIKIAQPNDILISVRAPVGPTNICQTAACIGRGLSAIRAKNGTDFKYVLYYLRSIEAQLSTQGRGSTFSAITQSEIRNLKIPLPPLPIQKRIAAILEKADAAREKRRQANKLTEQFLQSAFLDMFGDPVTNPKGWNKKKILDIGAIVTGNTPSKKSDEFYSKRDVNFFKPDDFGDVVTMLRCSKDFLTLLGAKEARICPRRTVLTTCIGIIGKVGILEKESCFNQQINAIIPDTESVTSEYLAHAIFRIKPILNSRANAPVVPILNKGQFSLIELPIPPLVKQQMFAALVEKVEMLRVKQRESEKELENLFNALMQRAFRGELVA